jgi:glycosyltransferase involved in cell wall biosynthesis
MTTLFLLLAAIGAHQLFNYEDIFAGLRGRARSFRWLKPLWCPECNAFWVSLLFASLAPLDLWPITLAPVHALAFYPPVWLAHKLREKWWPLTAPKNFIQQRIETLKGLQAPPVEAPPVAVVPLAAAPAAPLLPAVQALVEKQTENQSFADRVVLMSPLTSFEPSYSLTGVILDQARMLAMDPKRKVEIWVAATACMGKFPQDLRNVANIQVRACLPAVRLEDDHADDVTTEILRTTLLRELIPLGSATVITHDLLFQTAFTAYARAIHAMVNVPGFRWFHQCHSGPSARIEAKEGSPVWCRNNLPAGHKLICVSPAQQDGLAAQYGTSRDNVRVVPNARDPRGIWDLPLRVKTLIETAGLLRADVLQVYPVSATRLEDKGIDTLLRLFGAFRQNHKVECRLILALTHANAEKEKQQIAALHARALVYGMAPADLVVTSEQFPETEAQGLSGAEVQALFHMSNLFIFPTITEACSLVAMEAALAGNLLVLNSDLPSMVSQVPMFGAAPLTSLAIYYPFSGQIGLPVDTRRDVIRLQGEEILKTLAQDRSQAAAAFARRAFSYDTIGARLVRAIQS